MAALNESSYVNFVFWNDMLVQTFEPKKAKLKQDRRYVAGSFKIYQNSNYSFDVQSY